MNQGLIDSEDEPVHAIVSSGPGGVLCRCGWAGWSADAQDHLLQNTDPTGGSGTA